MLANPQNGGGLLAICQKTAYLLRQLCIFRTAALQYNLFSRGATAPILQSSVKQRGTDGSRKEKHYERSKVLQELARIP
jgi:hypothetical protein